MAISEIWPTEAKATVPLASEDPTESMSKFSALRKGSRFQIEVQSSDERLAELARKRG